MGAEQISPEIIQQTKALYGLDKPYHVQYVNWLGRLVTFDFGDSYIDNRPVITRIGEALPITLQLNLISLFIIFTVSIPIGIHSATHQYSRSDHFITLILFILYSLPSFWVAMLLIFYLGGGAGSDQLTALCDRIFELLRIRNTEAVEWLMVNVFHFQWFPIYGYGTPGSQDWPFHRWFLDRAYHMILPIFCLSYASFAAISRYARAGMIEVIRQDCIRTARAYGFSERTVVLRYALRNSLIPILTLLGTVLPATIAGSVIIESIFSIPGMGLLFYESILARDYPMVMGIFAIMAVLTLFGLILSDIFYALTDPRIRLQ
jgi:peptide/nickel transport system permease protein